MAFESEFVLYYVLAFILVALSLMFIIEAVYAYSDYFEAVNIRYYDNPTTCIFEPEYDEDFTTNHLPAVFNGIKEWEIILT